MPSSADADAATAHRRLLRPALAAGRPCPRVDRELPPRPRRLGRVARAPRRDARRARRRRTSSPTLPTSSAPRPRRRRSRAGCPRCAASTASSCSAARSRADPTLRVRAPKLPRRLPKSLTEKEVEALLAAPATDTALGLRDRAMLETLYATGLRVSELIGLRLSQLSLDMGVVRVVGKGSKERLVPLGEEAVGWVQRYLGEVRAGLAAGGKSDAVFLTARRGPMTRQAFWLAGQAPRAAGGNSRRAPVAARAAARLRDAPHQPRRGSSRRPAAARPRRHHDDDHLHARRARAAEGAARAAPSARLTVAPAPPRTATMAAMPSPKRRCER